MDSRQWKLVRRPVGLPVAPQKASVWPRSSASVRADASPGPGCQRLRRSEMRAMQVLNHNAN